MSAPQGTAGRSGRGGPSARWTLAFALGAALGSVLWAARRRVRQDAAESELWAEATDPVQD